MRKLTPIAAGLSLAVVATLAACTSPPEDFESQEVTITIGNQPPASQEAELAYFNDKLDAFREAHPNWTIETSEAVWDATTYPALNAGSHGNGVNFGNTPCSQTPLTPVARSRAR